MFSRHLFSRDMFSPNECFQHFCVFRNASYLKMWVVFKNSCRGHFFTPVCEHGIMQHKRVGTLRQKLAASNEIPFIAEQITSAVAGCPLWSGWRSSVIVRAFANMRRNYSRELFSIYDSVILLSGIADHTQAKAEEKLLADCLEIKSCTLC